MLGGDLDIRQFEFSIRQDDDRGYFRRRKHRSEVRTIIRGRVGGHDGCWWSGVGFIGIGFRKISRSVY